VEVPDLATLSTSTFDVDAVRARFSSLRGGFAFLDAPGGSQVPDEVGDAVAASFVDASGNLGAPYATGERVEEILAGAKADAARFLGGDGDNIVFGPNMTSVNFALSRTAGRDLGPGDEVLVTRLDHDGSVAPWVELAADRGFEVKLVDTTEDFRLDYEDLERKLSDRTRIVAFPWASNAFGTRCDATRICALAHEAGALAWVDAVHYAAHEPIDVAAIDCDVLLCSSYKFCGPHLGIAHVRPEVAERWRPYKARPSASSPLGRRFETGTPTYELLAGLSATFAYYDSLGGLEATIAHELAMGEHLVAGLPDGVELYGPALEERLPTYLLNVAGVPAATVAREMAKREIGVWHHDHYYALGVADRLPYPDEAIRVGLIHYNTIEEVDRFNAGLGELAAAAS
jgi:cysteine desulfurase family protein (TIGR01976 family)